MAVWDIDDPAGRGDLQDQIPLIRLVERVAGVRDVLGDILDVAAMDQFARGHLVAGGGPHLVQQCERGLHVRHGTDGGALVDEARIDFQGRGRDDTQRAFCADEEMLQVVAGVVLLQPLQPVIDLAIGQHHFQPQHLLPRIAELQHVHAARIGGNVAADHAGALRAQAEREEAAGIQRGLLHVLQDDAGLHRHGQAFGVDLADPVHALQAEHHGLAVRPGRAAAAKAGVAALRHQADAMLVAVFHHGGHFLHRRGLGDADAGAGELGAPVHGVALGRLRPAAAAELLGEGFENAGRTVRHGGVLPLRAELIAGEDSRAARGRQRFLARR